MKVPLSPRNHTQFKMLLLGALTGSALLDLLLVLTVLWSTWTFVAYRRLSHIPGPPTWALSIWPLFRLHQGGDIYHALAKLIEKHGSLVRIAPNILLTSDPDLIRRMNAPRSPYTRSDWYYAMRLVPGQDNVLSLLTDKEHDERRKKMAAGYSGKENSTLERDLDDCILDLCQLIDTRYAIDANDKISQRIPMDLARKLQFFTTDIMSKISFDANFHDLRDDNDNFDYIKEIETMFPPLFCTTCIPGVLKLFTNIGLLGMMDPTAQSQFGFGKIFAITRKKVSERFDAEKNLIVHKPDMLGSFLRHGLTQEQAEQESVTQLVAGSDTSATGMRSIFFNLISNPKAYTKLMLEIDAAVASGRIPKDHDAVIPNTVALELPYLQACIREGLRWLSPIAGMLPKKTPPEGDTIDGYFVPGGVSIAWSTKAIHHSKKLFGPDEQAFRPDRWIHTSAGGDEPSREKIAAMERSNDLIFGHGKYSCLGKSVAMIELNKVFVEVLRRFEFSLMKPEEGWRGGGCYGIFFQKGLWVTVQRRETKA